MRWGLLGLALLALGCNQSSGSSGAAAAAPPGQCVAFAGPLVGFTPEVGTAPAPRGGAIPDGVYDLQRIVNTARAHRARTARRSARR